MGGADHGAGSADKANNGGESGGGASAGTQQAPPPLSDVLVRVCGMLVGEFGYQIATSAGSTPIDQVHLIQNCLYRGGGSGNGSGSGGTYGSSIITVETTSVLLTSLAKLFNFFADQPVREAILKVISNPIFTKNLNTEVQQRSCEYCTLLGAVMAGSSSSNNSGAAANSNAAAPDALIQAVFDVTPAYYRKSTEGTMMCGVMMQELITRRQGAGGSRDLWLEELAVRDADSYQQSFQARQHRDAAAAAAVPK